MSRVVVIVLDDDGNRDVWDVFEADRIEWDWKGLGSNGSLAELTVSGSFHRRHQTPEGYRLSQLMRGALEQSTTPQPESTS